VAEARQRSEDFYAAGFDALLLTVETVQLPASASLLSDEYPATELTQQKSIKDPI
jgi:hypothetical protein